MYDVHFITKRIKMVYLLMYFLLASQVANVFGTLTIIREMNNATERKLTCLSEDDGSALVWNDVISEKSLNKSHEMRKYGWTKIS